MSHYPLVSASWLKGALNDPNVVVLDATFHLPIFNRDAFKEFEEERIPGAVFFDVDNIKDNTNPLPHMIPSPEVFAKTVGAMGISNNTHVVCYDTYGLFSSARPWWMFRLFGHDKVSVLDGGLFDWKASGLPLESGPRPLPTPAEFAAKFRADLLRRQDQVLDNLDTHAEVIIDARPTDRFDGSSPEPRPEVRSGHIPGARNISFLDLVDAETKKVADIRALHGLFKRAGVSLGKDKIVTSCGSGVTACSIAFAASLLGDETVAVYDGSWTEWGSNPDLPLETGLAKDSK